MTTLALLNNFGHADIDHADIMNTIINIVSAAIVRKLLDNPSFLDTLAKTIISSGLMNEVKQELYDFCALDNGRTTDEVRNLEQRVASLETTNTDLYTLDCCLLPLAALREWRS